MRSFIMRRPRSARLFAIGTSKAVRKRRAAPAASRYRRRSDAATPARMRMSSQLLRAVRWGGPPTGTAEQAGGRQVGPKHLLLAAIAAVRMEGMDGLARKRLVRLAHHLPDAAAPAATCSLEYLSDRGDPFVRHLTEAPVERLELSENGRRLLEEGYEDIDAGRVLGLEEVKRELGL